MFYFNLTKIFGKRSGSLLCMLFLVTFSFNDARAECTPYADSKFKEVDLKQVSQDIFQFPARKVLIGGTKAYSSGLFGKYIKAGGLYVGNPYIHIFLAYKEIELNNYQVALGHLELAVHLTNSKSICGGDEFDQLATTGRIKINKILFDGDQNLYKYTGLTVGLFNEKLGLFSQNYDKALCILKNIEGPFEGSSNKQIFKHCNKISHEKALSILKNIEDQIEGNSK